MQPRPPAYSRVSLAMMTHGEHANLLGNVHGGEIMKIADSTAGAVAARHSEGPAVTAAMDEMVFLTPVRIGDVLHVSAQVNWAGNSSMEVGVRAEADRWDQVTPRVHVASAYLVMVALDAEGSKRAVPELRVVTEEERRRHHEAEIRRRHRLARRDEIQLSREEAQT